MSRRVWSRPVSDPLKWVSCVIESARPSSNTEAGTPPTWWTSERMATRNTGSATWSSRVRLSSIDSGSITTASAPAGRSRPRLVRTTSIGACAPIRCSTKTSTSGSKRSFSTNSTSDATPGRFCGSETSRSRQARRVRSTPRRSSRFHGASAASPRLPSTKRCQRVSPGSNSLSACWAVLVRARSSSASRSPKSWAASSVHSDRSPGCARSQITLVASSMPAANSRSSRVLPLPASPTSQPMRARLVRRTPRCQSASASSSWWRPTNATFACGSWWRWSLERSR